MHVVSQTSIVTSGGSCASSEKQRPTATDLSTLRGVQDGWTQRTRLLPGLVGVMALLASLHNLGRQPCVTLPADRSVAIELLHEDWNR